MTYRQITVEGARVLVLGARPLHDGRTAHAFAMRATLVPIGLGFGITREAWAVLDFIPGNVLRPDEEAGPDSEPADGWREG